MATQDLSADLVLQAYAGGVFPMAETREDTDIFWVDPHHRGILPLDGLRVSRSLRKALRRGDYEITVDQDFAGVVEGCADRPETWINDAIRQIYSDLYDKGHAHSLEVRREGALIGGIYGVALGSAFFGESMFSRARDASKLALCYLVDRLRLGGFTLFDTQFVTPHLLSLGAVEIPRVAYRRKLADALAFRADFAAAGPPPQPEDLLQRITQTS